MRQTLRVVLGVLLAVLAAELGVRWFAPTGLLEPTDVWVQESSDRSGGDSALRAGLSGWLELGWLETDGQGHRRPRPPAESGTAFRVLLVGAHFAVAPGLDTDEMLAARLEHHLRRLPGLEGAEVVDVIPAGGPQRRLESTLAAIEQWRPDAVVLEWSAEDLGVAPEPYRIASQEPVVRLEVGRTPSALLTALDLWQTRRQRRMLEAAAFERARQSITGPADLLSKQRLERFLGVDVPALKGDDEDALQRAIMRDRYGCSRRRELQAAYDLLVEGLVRVREAGHRPVLLVSGPFVATQIVREAARASDLSPVVHPAPYLRDSGLRLCTPRSRPAAVVHDLAARQLVEALAARRLLPVGAALPRRLESAAREIYRFWGRKLGELDALYRRLKDLVPPSLLFDGTSHPYWLVAGVGPDGTVTDAASVELVIRARGVHLLVEGEVAPERASPPGLQALVQFDQEAVPLSADWFEVSVPGRRGVRWMFQVALMPSIYPLEILPAEGESLAGLKLRRVEFLVRDEDEGEDEDE